MQHITLQSLPWAVAISRPIVQLMVNADDEKTRWAIDVMTAWVNKDHEHSRQFVDERVHTYLREPDGCAGLVSGLINLSGLLLMGMEVTLGRSTPEILQAIASTLSRQDRAPDA